MESRVEVVHISSHLQLQFLRKKTNVREILSKRCNCGNYSKPRCDAEAPSTITTTDPTNCSGARSFYSTDYPVDCSVRVLSALP